MAAVTAAGMEALALTYPVGDDGAKTMETLTAYGVAPAGNQASAAFFFGMEAYLPYMAAALDTGLVFAGWNFAAEMDAATATTLLMNVAQMSGMARNYLGSTTDADIYQKLQSAGAAMANFDDEVLSNLGYELVLEGASTGYNLKYDGYAANFLPEYTLQYGHSNVTHALQLVGLLQSEGIEALVALEPKTSIYEYMVDWGDPTAIEPSATYAVVPIGDDRWVAQAAEYDLMLEFETMEDKNAFDALINEFSKKSDAIMDEDGNPTVPLLDGAWWQPLYSSRTPMADTAAYIMIQDNVIENGAYSIHPFSVADDNQAILDVVADVAPELSVEVEALYTNAAFYRYLTGTDHQ